MSAYILVEATLTQPKHFAAYARAVPAVVARYGGTYLVLGGDQESLEGDWGEQRIVIHHWPSMAAARAFWFSEEYAALQAAPSRHGVFQGDLGRGHRAGGHSNENDRTTLCGAGTANELYSGECPV